jgi:hypothetical protein
MKRLQQWWQSFIVDDGLGWWEAVVVLLLGIFLLAVLGQRSPLALIGIAVFSALTIGLVVRAVIAWWRDPLNLYDLF